MRRTRCHYTLKSNNCTEPKSVDLAAIKRKVVVLIRGGLHRAKGQRPKLSNNEYGEVSRRRSSDEGSESCWSEGQNQARWRSMKATGRDEIMHRQLSIWDCLQRDTAEREEYAGVCTSPGMVETEATNEQKRKRGLLEQIISSENLRRAAKRVKANRGSGGTDGMTVYELEQWLDENLESLQQQLRDGKYRPQPVRRVEIPQGQQGQDQKIGNSHCNRPHDPGSNLPSVKPNL